MVIKWCTKFAGLIIGVIQVKKLQAICRPVFISICLMENIMEGHDFSIFILHFLMENVMENFMEVHIFSVFILRFFSIFISALWRKSGNEYGGNIPLFSAFFHKKRSLNTPYYMEKKRKWIWRKFPLFSPLFLHNDFFPFSPLLRIYGDLRYGRRPCRSVWQAMFIVGKVTRYLWCWN